MSPRKVSKVHGDHCICHGCKPGAIAALPATRTLPEFQAGWVPPKRKRNS